MSDDSEALILDSIDRFIARDVKPVAHDLEAADAYPDEIVEKMKELGLFGATVAPEYGGLGISAVTYARIVERVKVDEHDGIIPEITGEAYLTGFHQFLIDPDDPFQRGIDMG